MSSNALLGLKVFAVDAVSRRLVADELSLVPGSNILDFSQTIPASGTVNLGASASNTVLLLSTTPVLNVNYTTNAGNVITPTASPYAAPPAVLPQINVTFFLVGGGQITLVGVSSAVVMPINITGLTITNTTSASVDVHVVQSTS